MNVPNAAEATAPIDVAGEDTENTQQFVAFQVEDREFAIDIMCVREIRGWTDTTAIPNSPGAVLGVINLRGSIVPVIDLRTSFGMVEKELTRSHVVVIVMIGDRTIGVVVDIVSDILTVKESDIQPLRDIGDTLTNSSVSQVIVLEGRIVGVISLEKFLEESLMSEIEEAIEAETE